MPRLSIFFGIVIYMYYDDHNPPHFHASYEALEGIFDFDGNLIKGYIPKKAIALIREWCKLHRKKLEDNWKRAKENKPLQWIEPLR